MTDLAYYAEYEAKGWHPAGDESLSDLERDGLLVTRYVGWGHYQVTLTAKGRAQLRTQLRKK